MNSYYDKVIKLIKQEDKGEITEKEYDDEYKKLQENTEKKISNKLDQTNLINFTKKNLLSRGQSSLEPSNFSLDFQKRFEGFKKIKSM